MFMSGDLLEERPVADERGTHNYGKSLRQ